MSVSVKQMRLLEKMHINNSSITASELMAKAGEGLSKIVIDTFISAISIK